jgi:hypothetical protein
MTICLRCRLTNYRMTNRSWSSNSNELESMPWRGWDILRENVVLRSEKLRSPTSIAFSQRNSPTFVLWRFHIWSFLVCGVMANHNHGRPLWIQERTRRVLAIKITDISA